MAGVRTLARHACGVLGLVFASWTLAPAAPVTVTTGEIACSICYPWAPGINVIDYTSPQYGDFTVSLPLTTPSNTLPSTLRVEAGLWDSPEVRVGVLVDGLLVGSFVANAGYISPGPIFPAFDTTGILPNGTVTIEFVNDESPGKYVIGQVWLDYDDSGVGPWREAFIGGDPPDPPDPLLPGAPTPVPEPATLWLVGAALGAAALLRRC